MFVSPIDVVGDGLDQLSDAGHGEALELPSREFTEEALDEIQPRGGGRGEVELHSRVFLKPCPNSRMLVCGVVVENDVRSGLINGLHGVHRPPIRHVT